MRNHKVKVKKYVSRHEWFIIVDDIPVASVTFLPKYSKPVLIVYLSNISRLDGRGEEGV